MLPGDALEAVTAARLRYVRDSAPGIARVRRGGSFQYRFADGALVRDPGTVSRIRALAIPPAWTDVWICPSPMGHIQAVGRDVRGRKQYRYHARWREVRDETKYARMIDFGRALPGIRRRVQRDLASPGLPRQKVLATVVQLLETTLIRVGNEEYARENRSYGLTTLRANHVRVTGQRLRFEFRGKGGKPHLVDLTDRHLARVVQQCQDLPGHELFQYVDESGGRQAIDSSDINAYLRSITGQEFTAKDFRTWAGTVLAATTLQAMSATGERPTKKRLTQAVATVAERLRNTPAICRKCYIHPAVLTSFLDSTLGPPLTVTGPATAPLRPALRSEERAVLKLLERLSPPRRTPAHRRAPIARRVGATG